MRNTLCRLTLAAGLCLIASTATAASSIVVTLDPADVLAGVPPRIEVTGVTMGGSMVYGAAGAGGQSTGKVNLKEVVLVKHLGASSPSLFRHLVSGRRLNTVLIEFLQQSKGQSAPYFAIRLSDVIVSNYALSGSVPASDTETVSLNYSRIEIFHPASKQQTSYDLRTGKAQ